MEGNQFNQPAINFGDAIVERRSVTFAPDSDDLSSPNSGREGRRLTSCFSSARTSLASNRISIPEGSFPIMERRSAISLEDEAKKAGHDWGGSGDFGAGAEGEGADRDLIRDASGRLDRRQARPFCMDQRCREAGGPDTEVLAPEEDEHEHETVWMGVSCSKCRLKISGCVLLGVESPSERSGFKELGRTEVRTLVPGSYTNFIAAIPVTIPKRQHPPSAQGEAEPDFSQITVMIYMAEDDACNPLDASDVKHIAASREVSTCWGAEGSVAMMRSSVGECERMEIGNGISVVLQDSSFLDACHVHLTVVSVSAPQLQDQSQSLASPAVARQFVLKGAAPCEGLGQSVERPVAVTVALGEELQMLPLTWAVAFQVLKVYHTDHILMLRALEEELAQNREAVESKQTVACGGSDDKFDREDFEESVVVAWLYECAALVREHLRSISLNIETAESGSFYSPQLGRHVAMKPSCAKADPAVRFVTTNLHIQRTSFTGFVEVPGAELVSARLPSIQFQQVSCGVFSDIAGTPGADNSDSAFVLRAQALEVSREIERNAVHTENGLMKGVLEKRGASFPYMWRTRLFTFDGEWLMWFKKEGEPAQGRLSVTQDVHDVLISDEGKQLHLDTSTPEQEGRVYHLYSKDTEAILHWRELLYATIRPQARMTVMHPDESSQWTNWGAADLVESSKKRELRTLALRATLRLDAAFSQAVGALVTAFCQAVDAGLARSYPGAEDILPAMCDSGFLFTVQSLLSNAGSEADMLGDCFEATKLLRNVFFRIKVVSPQGAPGEQEELSQGVIYSGILVEQGTAAHSQPIQVGWPCHYYHCEVEVPVRCDFELIPELLRCMEPIRVKPLMFTMGINANSTLSNFTKGAAKEGSLQHFVNDRSCTSLRNEYHTECLMRLRNKGTQHALQLADKLHALVLEIYNAHTKPQSNKNTLLLALSARYTRLAGGAVCTMCKSGKDRTGMAITLMEGRPMMDTYQEVLANSGVQAEGFLDGSRDALIEALRTHGVRRQNCLANTGLPFFAFHSIQQMFLPDEYKPPKAICCNSVQT